MPGVTRALRLQSEESANAASTRVSEQWHIRSLKTVRNPLRHRVQLPR